MEALLNTISHSTGLVSVSKKSVTGFFCLCILFFTFSCSSGSTAFVPDVPGNNLTIDLPGKSIDALIDDQGKLTQSVQIISEDGEIALGIDKGTLLLGEDGRVLELLKITVGSNNVTTPENTVITGSVVDINPQNGIADPALKLTLSCDSSTLPQGFSQNDLWIYRYTGEKWEIMGFKSSDSEPGKVTTRISHFGKYALLANIRPSVPLPSSQTSLVSSNLPQALTSGKPTLAELGSSSCVPCKQMKPILERLALDYKDKLNVVIIDIYDEPGIAQQYKVMAIPTQVVFDSSGKEVARHLGLWSREQIEAQLNKMEIK